MEQRPRRPAEKSQRRGGRPRDPEIDAAVLEAAASIMGEVGYSGLSLEAIARRAKTTKPALYRRWPARQHLVLDAVAARLGATAVPDTDCAACDLIDVVHGAGAAFDRVPADVLVALLADCVVDPELNERFGELLLDPPRAAIERVVARAVNRGQLRADLDQSIAVELLGSLIARRAFLPRQASDTDPGPFVLMLLEGMAADFDQLVASCESHGQVSSGQGSAGAAERARKRWGKR